MDFGAGGYIAGVRGTSIFMKKDKVSTAIQIAIVDSTNKTEAAKLYSGSTVVASLQVGDSYIDNNTAPTDTTLGNETAIGKTNLITANNWIKENSIEDIKYLGDKLKSDTINDKIKNEIIATLPSTTELNVIAPTADTTTRNDTTSTVTEAKNTTNTDTLIEATRSVECVSQ